MANSHGTCRPPLRIAPRAGDGFMGWVVRPLGPGWSGPRTGAVVPRGTPERCTNGFPGLGAAGPSAPARSEGASGGHRTASEVSRDARAPSGRCAPGGGEFSPRGCDGWRHGRSLRHRGWSPALRLPSQVALPHGWASGSRIPAVWALTQGVGAPHVPEIEDWLSGHGHRPVRRRRRWPGTKSPMSMGECRPAASGERGAPWVAQRAPRATWTKGGRQRSTPLCPGTLPGHHPCST